MSVRGLGMVWTWMGMLSTVGGLTLIENTPVIQRVPANASLALSVNATGTGQAFWVFEAHTQYYNLSLNSGPILSNISQGGSPLNHVGLIVPTLNDDGRNTRVYVHNHNQFDVSAVLQVQGYIAHAPVPGVCNGTQGANLTYQPALQVVYNQAMVEVTLSTAGIMNTSAWSCNTTLQDRDFVYSVYQRYLNERNFDEDYFLAELAETMIRPTDIKEYGTPIQPVFVSYPDGEGLVKVRFAAYPGTPAIYAAVVQHQGNQSSVYVSSATYGCNLDVNLPHNWFIGYMVVQNSLSVEYWGLFGYCGLFATVCGVFSLMMWVLIGIPVLAVIVPILTFGAIVACIIFFFPALNVQLLMNDKNYWLIFCGIALLPAIPLIPGAKFASLLTSAMLGSTLVMLPIEHYSGSNLKYIFFNVLRRSSVDEFGLAYLNPPYQTTDIALTVSWIALLVVAILFQFLRERDRFPFPPSSYQLWRWSQERDEERQRYYLQNARTSSSERTPLINGDEEFQQNMRNNIRQVQAQVAAALAEIMRRREAEASGEEESLHLLHSTAPPAPLLSYLESQTATPAEKDDQPDTQGGASAPRALRPSGTHSASGSSRSRGHLSAGPASMSSRSGARIDIESMQDTRDPFQPSTPEGHPA
ncbi:hypothetical protein TCAL_11709 [Tigriopus californicus]|uniref:TM7S3/TM198-like domain-containing protein n=1 Tax=Tigriopus californicus TaxID=6832 RepID=A0A553NAW9_TIGCA|nr:hypothetical protein TCAL_11709 [Tigriopus californicus]